MQNFFQIILGCILLAIIDAKLEYVVEVHRHGARGPLNDYWNGKDQKYYWGQLVPSGMREHYILGQAMRKEYIDDL